MRYTMEFFNDVIVPLLVAIATLFIAVFLPAIFVDNYYSEYRCAKYELSTGRATKWVFMDACYVDAGDSWLTLGEYKAVIIAREGFKAKR